MKIGKETEWDSEREGREEKSDEVCLRGREGWMEQRKDKGEGYKWHEQKWLLKDIFNSSKGPAESGCSGLWIME